jgi:DNA-binding response OmpR family regulator
LLKVEGMAMALAKILIVDDEPDIAEVLGDRLEGEGYEVRIVHSARACYEAVAKETPGLIMLDIMMPGISGLEALVELRERHPEVPVLMVSASTVRNAAREAVEKGAAGFVLKPFDPEDLMRKVREIVGGRDAP